MPNTASLAAYQGYEHFNVTSPSAAVAHVEINRPKKLNAFFKAMWLEFGAIFRQLSDDPDFRAVVLSGAGDRAFTAGLDVASVSQSGPLSPTQREGDEDVARRAKGLRQLIDEFQGCVSSVEKCEKPVIVVLHGIAIGLGIDIATAADIRICTSDVRLSVKEVDIGMPADVGSLSRLPKIVGSQSWVKDVTLTAREFHAPEALQQGFVSRVLDDKASAVGAAFELAALLATKSPVAVQGTKELVNHGLQYPYAESLRYTSIWNSAAVQSEDFRKGLLSGLQKKRATFSKL